ncbi:MAG: trigger factor [Betaproteobacteria bacterium]|uniref:Trigger factor n=1 Tax=Serpentinimonas maccroryi TaxID=1458426 RepID=A0A060NMA1_9BURK|nr:trigger factor [Serpentinimonas maccroryi]MCL5969334.1 trigger factor [Betaproteobacteria bacterium]MCM2478566.1 trigger factor [Serpentinimonas maccroryi]BAO83676.1 FKBP-type peptidyl-prolyl cis-trans isomerase trigger factor [Serpentinimonas maccroryi]
MAVTVETLDKLERKITLELSLEQINQEVQNRLKRMQRQVKLDGFRPGKVPLSVVQKRYGGSVHYEVMNDQLGQAFQSAAQEAQLRIAGTPSISEKEGAPEGAVAFEAVFEVYPEVKIGDLSAATIEKFSATVDEAAIERTLEILRKQRRSFVARAADEPAQEGDQVRIDFEGKIDGEPFEGGKAEGFQFVLGEGQMLKEFEEAVRGMRVGESKTFPLNFPAEYHGKDVAGKQADFLVTLQQLDAAQLPAVDDELASSLGVAGGSVDALRADIRKNLEREVKFRLQMRNKTAVMDALVAQSELDVPKSSVAAEVERLIEGARANLKERGVQGADQAPIPAELFQAQAERRVRLGLVVAELVNANRLQATPEQVDAHIQELASSYESPADVVRWYQSDRQRLAEIEALVLENNVTEFVLARAQVSDKAIAFDELMGKG